MSDEHSALLHELNNLLAVILSYSELLTLATPEGDPARADLAEIEKATKRAAEIVVQMSKR